MAATRGKGPISGINVTPFVDVVLVLLIIFMVTANYMATQSIQVDLPKAATADAPDQAMNLGFSIDKRGQLYLAGEPILFSDLKTVIEEKRKLAAGKKLQALIGADKDSRHGVVVKLIDELRLNGVVEFAINIDPATEQSEETGEKL